MFGLVGAVMLDMAGGRFEVDFGADFSGAQLSAIVGGWFQVRPRSSPLRVPSAVKTVAAPGADALPSRGGRPADTAEVSCSTRSP